MMNQLISIIVPTLNEGGFIGATLEELRHVPNIEIIVADGGSSDDTTGIAKQAGAQVITTQSGRAVQMNAGAAAARGNILLFLHADTRLSADFADQIKQSLAQPGTAAGAFKLALAGKGLGLRIIELTANLRSTILKMPYGDQAIFLTAEMFRAVDGFPHQPIMEDFELIRQLKKRGKITILPLKAMTSSRRWRKLGILKTTLLNQAVITGYLLGITPERLARWYGAGG